MLYRVFVVGVVAFWLVMSALLLRLELSPERSGFFDIPVSHVVSLAFAHEQPSVLTIYEKGDQVGTLLLRPKSGNGRRELHLSGNIGVGLPWTERQRITWSGQFHFDRKLQLQSLEISLGSRNPAIEIRLWSDLSSRAGSYEVWQQDELLQRGFFELDELPELARQFGWNNALVHSVRTQRVTARPAELRVGKEKIEAYLVLLTREQETLAEVYVSQLGQVLKANTIFGYSLSAEGLQP